MQQRKRYLLLFLLISLLYSSLVLYSCNSDDDDDSPMETKDSTEADSDSDMTKVEEEAPDSLVSAHNLELSHFNGRDCMQCHFDGGDGPGVFTIAGSIYNSDRETPNPNGTVRIYSAPQGGGEVLATVEVDALGNFYTTDRITLGRGGYPSIENSDGRIKYMGSRTSHAQCNGCHGVGQLDKIWVE